MSDEQVKRAVQSLYDETSTRDELDDDDAETLLKWGEAQIQRLAAQNMDDAEFDEACGHLTRLLTRVNRFAARRSELSAEDQQLSLSRILESASSLGLAAGQASVEIFAQQAAPSASSETLRNVIDLLEASGSKADADTSQPTAQAASAEQPEVPMLLPTNPKPAAADIQPLDTEKVSLNDESSVRPPWES